MYTVRVRKCFPVKKSVCMCVCERERGRGEGGRGRDRERADEHPCKVGVSHTRKAQGPPSAIEHVAPPAPKTTALDARDTSQCARESVPDCTQRQEILPERQAPPPRPGEIVHRAGVSALQRHETDYHHFTCAHCMGGRDA